MIDVLRYLTVRRCFICKGWIWPWQRLAQIGAFTYWHPDHLR